MLWCKKNQPSQMTQIFQCPNATCASNVNKDMAILDIHLSRRKNRYGLTFTECGALSISNVQCNNRNMFTTTYFKDIWTALTALTDTFVLLPYHCKRDYTCKKKTHAQIWFSNEAIWLGLTSVCMIMSFMTACPDISKPFQKKTKWSL